MNLGADSIEHFRNTHSKKCQWLHDAQCLNDMAYWHKNLKRMLLNGLRESK